MQSHTWCSVLVISLCLLAFGGSNGLSQQINDGLRRPPVAGFDPDDHGITLTASETTRESDRKPTEDPKASGQNSKDDQTGADKPQPQTPPTEIRRLKEQIIELQNKGKLGLRKVVLCSSVEGYGVYSPIEPGQPNPKVYLYFEPENVSTLVTGDRYIIDLSVDLFLYDATGKLIAGKETIFRINRVSRSPIFDVFYKVELNLKKPGGQGALLKTVLHDKIKNGSVSSTYRINVDSTGKKPLEPI
jgi:hypothetical protein